jgi:hypothetical protein
MEFTVTVDLQSWLLPTMMCLGCSWLKCWEETRVCVFNFVGFYLSYLEVDINTKAERFSYIYGTIKRTLKNKTKMDTQMKLFKTVAMRSGLYVYEAWVMTSKDNSRLQAAEI